MSDHKQYIRFSWPIGHRSIIRDNYTSSLTDDRANLKEIDMFLNEVEHIYYQTIRPVYYYAVLYLLYTTTSILFIEFGKNMAKTDIDWLIELAWYLSFLITLTAGYLFYEYRKEKVNTKLQLLIQVYYSIFGAKELRWVIPGDFPNGIELWRDYLAPKADAYIEMGNHKIDCSRLDQKAIFTDVSVF